MAINKPIVAAGTTKEKKHILDQPVEVHPVGPGGSYLATTEEGEVIGVAVDQPEREGQVFCQTVQSGQNRWAYMYVAININGTPQWVRVATGEVINSFTGRPFDPIYDS